MHNSKNFKNSFVIWGLLGVFLAFQFVLRLSLGILKEDVMSKYGINLVEFGNLAGIYYLGYSGMQVPAGILLDKFNFRVVTFWMVVITSIGTIIFAITDSWKIICMGRFLMGFGSAVAFLACAKAVSIYFSVKHQPIMLGFSVMIGLLGAVFGGVPMRILFNYFGYSNTFLALSVIGFTIAGLLLLLDFTERQHEATVEDKVPMRKVFKLLTNPSLLLIGLLGGLMVGSFEGFADVWAMPFFLNVFSFSESQSISLSSAVFFGLAIGGPVVAWMEGYFKSISMFLFLLGCGMCAIFLAVFLLTKMSFIVTLVLMIILGILSAYQIAVFTIATSLVHKRYVGITVSMTNCLIMSCGYFFHRIISATMYYCWDGSIDQFGQKIYSYKAYLLGLSSIPIFCFVGLLGFLYLHYKSPKKINL